jgi:hypothetical protein
LLQSINEEDLLENVMTTRLPDVSEYIAQRIEEVRMREEEAHRGGDQHGMPERNKRAAATKSGNQKKYMSSSR